MVPGTENTGTPDRLFRLEGLNPLTQIVSPTEKGTEFIVTVARWVAVDMVTFEILGEV